MHSRRPIGLMTFLVDQFHLANKPRILLLTITRESPHPFVETTAGDLQGPTHPANIEGLPVVVNELESQSFSFAK